MNSQTIVVEQTFQIPVKRLWKVITNLSDMKQWFFEAIPSFEAKEGFETQFNVSTGERDFLHLWKIVEVIPFKKIVYDWRYKNYLGSGLVIFETIETGENSKLKLTATGIESFIADIPEFSRESCAIGWQYFIKESLKKYVDEM